jgi:3-isopropylmalate/(R)-2-methylmalate dehydratase small subunit
MDPFKTHIGKAIIIDRANIDTDQIIPKEHLKTIKRSGFSTALFSDWRYQENGEENANFELNNPLGKKSSFLITGNNFGCGSSREHAVWALKQYGFHVIVAPSFADIFKTNALKNGLLLIELPSDDLRKLKQTLSLNPAQEVEIDLNNQWVKLENLTINFCIDAISKERLIKGLDDINITLKQEHAIAVFEKKHDTQLKKAT